MFDVEGDVDPRVEAKERYLKEVLRDYYGKEGISKRASRRWALVGIGRSEKLGLATVFILMFLSLFLPQYFIEMDIGFVGLCLGVLMMLLSLLILSLVLWGVTVGSSVTHPGWFRAYEVPLSDTIENIGHAMSENDIEVTIVKIVLRDLQFDARGAVFTTKGTNIDVSVWKDRYQFDRTVVHMALISSGERFHARNIMDLIEERLTRRWTHDPTIDVSTHLDSFNIRAALMALVGGVR